MLESVERREITVWLALSLTAALIALAIGLYLHGQFWGLIVAPLIVGFLTFCVFLMRIDGIRKRNSK
jgi:uncharacterized membrane protein